LLHLQDEDLNIPGQLLHMLDDLGSKVELQGEPTAKTVRENIALLLADVTPDNPIRGMRVAARDTDAFGNDTFSFINSKFLESLVVSGLIFSCMFYRQGGLYLGHKDIDDELVKIKKFIAREFWQLC
jgi:hypothetical protein